jgi:hypothetical protein
VPFVINYAQFINKINSRQQKQMLLEFCHTIPSQTNSDLIECSASGLPSRRLVAPRVKLTS